MFVKFLLLSAVLLVISMTETVAFNTFTRMSLNSRQRLTTSVSVNSNIVTKRSALTQPSSSTALHFGLHSDVLSSRSSPISALQASATIVDTPVKTAEQQGAPKTTEKSTPNKTLKKLLPLGAMLFFILFNYTILRDTKDVLVVTAPGGGAEIIPFLKTYVNLPSAIGFTFLYSHLCSQMSSDKVFYVLISSFLAFFGAFAGVIYPNRDMFHPHAAADYLTGVLPSLFKPFISIFRYWTYAVFYTLANLWVCVCVFHL